MEFSWSRGSYIQNVVRGKKEVDGRGLAGVWKLKGIRKKTDKGICPLRLDEEDVKHVVV